MRTIKKVSSNSLKLDETSHPLTAHPTVRGELVTAAQGASMSEETIEATYPLSSMQQGMLFHSLYQPRSGIDIEQMVCHLPEAIDVPNFLKAWNCTVDRHPILRTRFLWDSANAPTQIVHQQVRLSLKQQDWRQSTSHEQRDRLAAYLQHDRQQGFDLTQSLNREPLMRLALFRLAEADYQFVWTFHHILLDGRSFPLVLQEVFAFYKAFCKGDRLSLRAPAPLPRLH